MHCSTLISLLGTASVAIAAPHWHEGGHGRHYHGRGFGHHPFSHRPWQWTASMSQSVAPVTSSVTTSSISAMPVTSSAISTTTTTTATTTTTTTTNVSTAAAITTTSTTASVIPTIPLTTDAAAEASDIPTVPVTSKVIAHRTSSRRPVHTYTTTQSPVTTIVPSSTAYPLPTTTSTTTTTAAPTYPTGGSPPSYVDLCANPGAELPPLPTPVDDDEASWWVWAHNMHRRNHSAPDVTWDDQLAKDAQAIIAQHNGVCSGGHVMNVNGDSYGQNIAGSQWMNSAPISQVASNQQAATGSMALWYGEADAYTSANYAEGFAENHFTQVIWKSSVKVGCAVQQCGYHDSKWYSAGYWTVCNYQSPGNFNNDVTQISQPLCHPAVVPAKQG